jgi:hypothetical protein
LALGIWQNRPKPWVVLGDLGSNWVDIGGRGRVRCDPLPTGIGFGWPLGGPSVAQGPPKRDAREAQAWIHAKPFVCNKQREIAGWGCGARSAPLRSGDSVHQEIEGIRRSTPELKPLSPYFSGLTWGGVERGARLSPRAPTSENQKPLTTKEHEGTKGNFRNNANRKIRSGKLSWKRTPFSS